MKTTHALALAAALLTGSSAFAASVGCLANAGNLIANCGFENGSFSSWTLSGLDVPGEADNLYGIEGVDPFGPAPHAGDDQAYFLDIVGRATTLAQTFATTSGSSYTVSFYLAQQAISSSDPAANSFVASFGGGTLASLTNVGNSSYSLYSYNVAATSGSTTFSLAFGDTSGFFLLDDVSVVKSAVTAVPEPSVPLMMGAGLLGLAAFARRRRQRGE